jgi:hypothetical protein
LFLAVMISFLSVTQVMSREHRDELILENWMTIPFDNEIEEETHGLEQWMTESFDNQLTEEPVGVENWMTESFDNRLTEEPVGLEQWMTEPLI